MTAILTAPYALSSVTDAAASRIDPAAAQPAVLTISALPRHLRLRVEGLIYEHLGESMLTPLPAGTDIWDIPWFTRWRLDPAANVTDDRRPVRTVSCREVISGSVRDLDSLSSALAELAETFQFEARVEVQESA